MKLSDNLLAYHVFPTLKLKKIKSVYIIRDKPVRGFYLQPNLIEGEVRGEAYIFGATFGYPWGKTIAISTLSEFVLF